MSTKIAVPDVANTDLHRPLAMSSVSSNTLIPSQPVLHSLGNPPLSPMYSRPDDSIVLEGLPHVHARLDAR